MAEEVLKIEWDDVEMIKKMRENLKSNKSSNTTSGATETKTTNETTQSNDDQMVEINSSTINKYLKQQNDDARLHGIPVSGRVWKDVKSIKRASKYAVTPPSLHPSWEEKQQEKKRLDAVKLKDKELKEMKKKEREVCK